MCCSMVHGVAELRRQWLPGGEEPGQDAVVDFGVEDGEGQPVGVRS
jgi:hypothetical protein